MAADFFCSFFFKQDVSIFLPDPNLNGPATFQLHKTKKEKYPRDAELRMTKGSPRGEKCEKRAF